MAITSRKVKNKRDGKGELTGKSGTVYDVNIKYKSADGFKQHIKKGFSTKKDATEYEAEMRTKLTNNSYSSLLVGKSKMTISEYMDEWIEQHGSVNLRPSTYATYKGYIKNHIKPYLGYIELGILTPQMLDKMFKEMLDKGLSPSTVKYCQRILSVAFEAARKYRYIEYNPAKDTITKFGKIGETPDPYNVNQMQALLGLTIGTKWEVPIMLAGLYGLRISEVLGLRWKNISMNGRRFVVKEQLPFGLPRDIKIVEEFSPVKGNASDGSGERVLPITPDTYPFFKRQENMIRSRKQYAVYAGTEYYDNDLFYPRTNGVPFLRDRMSTDFGQMLRYLELPHIRFHDLRHSAATNMFELTGDFYTVGSVLGHSLKGTGIQLNISTNIEAMTANYVDVRMERKLFVLEKYHNALHSPTKKREANKILPIRNDFER